VSRVRAVAGKASSQATPALRHQQSTGHPDRRRFDQASPSAAAVPLLMLVDGREQAGCDAWIAKPITPEKKKTPKHEPRLR